jgi:hypothetical protein
MSNKVHFDIDKVEEIYTEFLSQMMKKGHTTNIEGYIYIYAAVEMIHQLIHRKMLDIGLSHDQLDSLKKTAERAGMDMVARASGLYITEKDGEA